MSSKPGKQRARFYQAPLHAKRKQIVGHLSKELRTKYKKRSFHIRKGDEVKIVRGDFKGKSGKVTKIDCKKMVIYVEGIARKKTSGTEKQIPLRASNAIILTLFLEDKKRIAALKRGKEKESKGE
ncbi:MAG: 50S ribosomal protein L24 [Candidatus Diapherotrites archaeon CG08_land_8_20_14_0_20_34_12]|nr:MAG: 50S ribosomal protein L24 [Candidatus Diapherotrites archaeon CG08_land_8_20_14_0_20_34_12]